MSAERRGGGNVGRSGEALGITPLVRYVSFATAGYKPEEMGWGRCSRSRRL